MWVLALQHQAVAEHTLGVSRLLSKSWERIVERLCEKCGMSTVTLIESHTGALSMHAHTRALPMHAHTISAHARTHEHYMVYVPSHI